MLLIQTQILTVLIHNLKSAWPTKIVRSAIFEFLWTIYYKMHIVLTQKSVDTFLDSTQSMLIFWLGCSTPLITTEVIPCCNVLITNECMVN